MLKKWVLITLKIMLKKWVLITLKAAVSGGLLWYVFHKFDVDLATVFQKARHIDLIMLTFALFALCFQACLGGLRWRAVAIAIGAPLTFWNSLRLFYIGMFFNQALPGGTGGDAVRMYLGYRSGLTMRTAINGVMLERIVVVIALVLMVDITQPFFSPEINPMQAKIIHFAALLLTALAVGGLVVIMILDCIPERMQKWKIVRGLGYLAGDTRRLFFNPRYGFEVLFWGLLTHINLSFVVFLLADGLALSVTFFDCLTLVPPVVLVTTIPISIGGWGVREQAIVTAFALVGVARGDAVTLSIMVGLCGLLISLPGGLVWLFSHERSEGTSLRGIDEELSTS